MKKLLTITTFFLGCSILYSQTSGFNITRKDLEITSCPIDSDANAFYMYEKGYSYIDTEGNYDLITEYEAKIKILNKNAFDEANIAITLYNNHKNSERVAELTAKTYNLENGRVQTTNVEKQNIYNEKINANYTQVKFGFPNIKEGSVIHYKYIIRSPFRFNFQNWRFQEAIPKLYSQFDTKIPAVFRYRKKLVGFLDFDSQNGKVQFDCISLSQIRADCEIDTYVMKNIPAFIEEDFMLSAENYISQIEYEMVSTQWLEGTTYYTKEWKDVDKDIKSNQSLGLESRKTSYFKNILPQEILSLDSDLKKAKSIYYHLQRKLKWNRRLQIFKDYNVKKAFESKTGSLAELNTILLNTLKAQGFNVEMMLLSTRKNGLATKLYPSLSEFNYMIVKLNINDQSYFLDLTDKFKKFGELPFKCYNQYGRVFDFKNSSYWQDLIPKNRLAYKKDIYYDLKEDVIQGKARFKSDGYINQSKRLKYFRDKEAYLKSFEKNETLELLNYEGKNFLDLEKPFIETISFEVEPEEIGEDIYFNPFLFNEFEKNPFQLKERNYPVDFGKLQEYKTQITFEIPEDYDLEFTPEKKLIKTYDNSVVVEINMSKKENKIVLTRYIYINKITLEANQYQNLKRVFQAILDVQNNTILVLKKK